MKIKSAAETASLGKAHAYLGHFAKAKHINRGHNSDPISDVMKGQQSDKDFYEGMDKALEDYRANKAKEEAAAEAALRANQPRGRRVKEVSPGNWKTYGEPMK